MRELVYLSHGKLEQYLPTLRKLWLKPKMHIKVPFVELDMDTTPDAKGSEVKRIERVIDQIQKSATWFTDEEVQPGQWAMFEAPLNYHVMESSKIGSVLLFIDRSGPTAGYTTGGTIRLLMHGSPRNLVGSRPTEPAVAGGTLERTGLNPSSGPDFVRMLTQFDPISPRFWRPRRSAALGTASQHFVQELDKLVHPDTAAWMKGFARITADVTHPQADHGGRRRLPGGNVRYILASPLYVEYSTDSA